MGRQRGGDGFSFFPARVVEAAADQVHNASLYRGLRERRRDRIREAFEPIDHGDQDVVDAAATQLVKHLEPELRALGLFDPALDDN